MDKIQNIYEKIKIGSYQGPIVNNDFDANLKASTSSFSE